MKYFIISLVVAMHLTACGQKATDRKVGSRCDGCEMMTEGMPAQISWETIIANAGEPGEPLIISGTIYKNDRKTPAPNVILYVYHTDAKGIYAPSPNQKEAIRHGHLRGWMKTDSRGRYKFTTIRPASYPSRPDVSGAPQHIHPLIKEPGATLYWIDEFLFDDDPLLTQQEKNRQEKRGGSGIIHLTKNSEGIWVGQRDIILGMNIPNY